MNSFMKAMTKRRTDLEGNEKGFTLIELLVVVIIIGILAAIAIPVYLGQQEGAKDSAVKSDVANAQVATTAYLVDNPNATAVPLNKTDLGKYGFTQSDNTSFTATTVAPGACISASRVDKATNTFHINAGEGVKSGAC